MNVSPVKKFCICIELICTSTTIGKERMVCMEKNKIKIIFGFGVFCVFFISAVLLLIANFVSRMFTILVMSNMNYITDVPIISEPVLLILSGICFIISILSLVISILFLKNIDKK